MWMRVAIRVKSLTWSRPPGRLKGLSRIEIGSELSISSAVCTCLASKLLEVVSLMCIVGYVMGES